LAIDDESQVGVDHPVLRVFVAHLDAFGEGDLLERGQKGVTAGLVEKELERVRRARGQVAVLVRGWAGTLSIVVAHLDAPFRRPVVEVLKCVLVELQPLRQLVDFGQQEHATLLPSMEKRFDSGIVTLTWHGTQNCRRVIPWHPRPP